MNFQKTLSACFMLLCLCLASPAQISFSLSFKCTADTLKVDKYVNDKPASPDEKKLWVKMSYGDADILNAEDIRELHKPNVIITSVDYVYTNFRKQHVQLMLNRKRMAELYFALPDLFGCKATTWRFVEQTGYITEQQAENMFHGFVITYNIVKSYALENEKSFKKTVAENRDTSIFKDIRNSHPDEKSLICVDLTGSMGPYYIQIFQWFALYAQKHTFSFALFNDGDLKKDEEKKAGNTGGVYLFKTNNMDTLASYVVKCVNGGTGGDTPENNIEATLKGIKKYKDIKKVIMIADNYAGMRDYSLMGSVRVPVHVVLCGVRQVDKSPYINTEYLDLARCTKGGVCTIEKELIGLEKIKEGEKLTLGKFEYLLAAGRFVRK